MFADTKYHTWIGRNEHLLQIGVPVSTRPTRLKHSFKIQFQLGKFLVECMDFLLHGCHSFLHGRLLLWRLFDVAAYEIMVVGMRLGIGAFNCHPSTQTHCTLKSVSCRGPQSLSHNEAESRWYCTFHSTIVPMGLLEEFLASQTLQQATVFTVVAKE